MDGGPGAPQPICCAPAAPLPPARPGTGWGEGCPGCRGSQPEEATRDRGRGAARFAGPAAAAPLSLRSATRVGGGEGWQMASGRGGPRTLGNRAEHRFQPTPPQPLGEVGQKNGSVAREGGMAVRCGLRPHVLFTYAEKERGGKGRASVCPGAPSRLQAERTAPKVFERSSAERQPRRRMEGKSCPLTPAPGGAAHSISAGADSYVPLFSRSVLACFEIQKALLPRRHSLLTNTRTHTPTYTPSSSSLPHELQHSLLGAKLSYCS